MNEESTCREEFGEIEEGDEDLCRALWISVIVQAFIDAGGKSTKARNIREQQQAMTWLSSGEGSDFATVCDLAGVGFRTTQRRLFELLDSERETLDFRCLTKSWGKSQSVESRARFFQRARRNARNRQEAFAKTNSSITEKLPRRRCG